MTCVRIPNGTITLADEVDADPAWDLRTRAGREQEIFAQLRTFGGFTVFWATENALRARTLDRLQDEGKITTEPAQFPWTKARVTDDPMPSPVEAGPGAVSPSLPPLRLVD